MSVDPTTTAETEAPESAPESSPAAELQAVTEDLLVEDVSIDGMCGVY